MAAPGTLCPTLCILTAPTPALPPATSRLCFQLFRSSQPSRNEKPASSEGCRRGAPAVCLARRPSGAVLALPGRLELVGARSRSRLSCSNCRRASAIPTCTMPTATWVLLLHRAPGLRAFGPGAAVAAAPAMHAASCITAPLAPSCRRLSTLRLVCKRWKRVYDSSPRLTHGRLILRMEHSIVGNRDAGTRDVAALARLAACRCAVVRKAECREVHMPGRLEAVQQS